MFEPNAELLWAQLRNSIGQFLNKLWRNGGLTGTSSKNAYFINCGLGISMTQNDVLNKRLRIEIGFAPLKPAEFIIVRIQQKTR